MKKKTVTQTRDQKLFNIDTKYIIGAITVIAVYALGNLLFNAFVPTIDLEPVTINAVSTGGGNKGMNDGIECRNGEGGSAKRVCTNAWKHVKGKKKFVRVCATMRCLTQKELDSLHPLPSPN